MWVRQHRERLRKLLRSPQHAPPSQIADEQNVVCPATGSVRRKTAGPWRRSTASTRTSKPNCACWRPCSAKNRTRPKATELRSGAFGPKPTGFSHHDDKGNEWRCTLQEDGGVGSYLFFVQKAQDEASGCCRRALGPWMQRWCFCTLGLL